MLTAGGDDIWHTTIGRNYATAKRQWKKKYAIYFRIHTKSVFFAGVIRIIYAISFL